MFGPRDTDTKFYNTLILLDFNVWLTLGFGYAIIRLIIRFHFLKVISIYPIFIIDVFKKLRSMDIRKCSPYSNGFGNDQ